MLVARPKIVDRHDNSHTAQLLENRDGALGIVHHSRIRQLDLEVLRQIPAPIATAPPPRRENVNCWPLVKMSAKPEVTTEIASDASVVGTS